MFTVPMSLVDFLPVLLFGWAALLLQKDLYNKMSKGAYALFCAGMIDIFMAGFLKALYKFLYAMGICDFVPLKNLFFPVQSIGFTLAGISMLCLIMLPQGKNRIYSAAVTPAVFSGTFIFVFLMVLGLLFLDAGLVITAAKMKKKGVAVLFIISFICAVMMGYLSSKDFTESWMNWSAEIINTAGQLLLLLGVKALDRAGLENFQLK